MKKILIIGLMGLMTLAGSNVANAQYNETNNMFYHIQRAPQSNLLNPALFPNNTTWYISFPGIDFQLGSPLAINDFVFYNKTANRTIISLDSMMNKMTDGDRLRIGANANIFGFGFKVKNTFINFNSRLVNYVNLGFPSEMVNALRNGNIDENGNVIPMVEMLDGDILNATSYLETGLGVGHYFEKINLTVGIRAKMLFGVGNVQTDNTRLEFVTDPNMDSVSARMYYEIQAATFAPYDTAQGKFLFNGIGDIFSSGNTGFAFDLGAKYDWGPFSFSLSINDLSAGIHWKNNVMTWKPQNGQGVVVFNGLDFTTMLNGGSFSLDSLSNYIENQLNDMKPVKQDSGDYWFSIPTKFNLGANYNFGRLFRAGFLFHGQLDRGLLSKSNALTNGLSTENTFRWNGTFSLGMNVYERIELTAANSIVYDGSSMDFFNPGIGIIFSIGRVFQFYFMSDYVSNFYLTDSKAFNLKLGLNLLFGSAKKKTIEG